MKTTLKIAAIAIVTVFSTAAFTSQGNAQQITQAQVVNGLRTIANNLISPQSQQAGHYGQVPSNQIIHQQPLPPQNQTVIHHQPVVQHQPVHQHVVANQQPILNQKAIQFLTDIAGTYRGASRTGTLRKSGNDFEWVDTTGLKATLVLDINRLRLVATYADEFGVVKKEYFQFTIAQSGHIQGFSSSGMYFTRTK